MSKNIFIQKPRSGTPFADLEPLSDRHPNPLCPCHRSPFTPHPVSCWSDEPFQRRTIGQTDRQTERHTGWQTDAAENNIGCRSKTCGANNNNTIWHTVTYHTLCQPTSTHPHNSPTFHNLATYHTQPVRLTVRSTHASVRQHFLMFNPHFLTTYPQSHTSQPRNLPLNQCDWRQEAPTHQVSTFWCSTHTSSQLTTRYVNLHPHFLTTHPHFTTSQLTNFVAADAYTRFFRCIHKFDNDLVRCFATNHAHNRQTDRQTDGIAMAYTALSIPLCSNKMHWV